LTKKIGILGLCATALAVAGCGSKNDGLANVGGEEISLQEFREYLEIMPNARVSVQGQVARLPVMDTLGFQAMQDLVGYKILMQLAADEGVLPTPADVAKELTFRTQLDPAFVNNLTSTGLTLAQVRDSLKIDLARERLLTKGITVTKEDAEQYIKDNPRQFVEPATAQSYVIVVSSEAARDQVDRDLAGGEPFKQVAMRSSELDNAKATEGRFQYTVLSQYPSDIRPIIERTPELKQTEWIKFDRGFAKFYVESKTPEKPVSMDDNRKEQLRRQLALQYGQAASDLDRRLVDKLKESKVNVGYKSMSKRWDEYAAEVTKRGELEKPNQSTSKTDSK